MPDMYFDVDVALTEVPVNIMPLVDDTDFKSIEGAVAYNAAGMALFWHFVTSAGVYNNGVAVTPTSGGVHDWTDHGTSGIYTIEIPASGGTVNNDSEGYGWWTGVATGILPWRSPIYGFRAAALNDALCDGGDNLDVNTVQWLGTACATPTTAGVPEVDVTHCSGSAQATIATQASVTTIDDFLDTEVAAILAAVDTEVAAIKVKTDYLPSATAGSAGGVFIAGSNAATSITTALTANITGNVTGNLSGSVGSVTGAVGSVTGSVGSVTGAVGSVTGAVGSVTGNVGGNVTGSVGSVAANGLSASSLAADAVAEIADGVWDEALAGHAGAGTAGEALSAAGTAGDPWTTALPGAYGAGTAGKIIGDNINATISSRASQTSVDTIDDFLDTEVAAILADTNELQTDWTNGGRLDLLLDGAASAGDPWTTSLPGAYGAGTAGYIVGTNVDATVSSRASQTSLDTVDNLLDTEVAAIKTVVDDILVDTGTTLPATLATIAGYIDTEVAAVLAAVDTEVAAILADTNELQTDWADGGRLDLLLDGASSAGDPWGTALPGAYGAGTAGKIVGDNINATISSRASQTSLDTVDDLLDTEVAAIKSVVDDILIDTAEIGAAGAGLTALATAASAAAIEADTQNIRSRIPAALENGRIKSKVEQIHTHILTDAGTGSHAVGGS